MSSPYTNTSPAYYKYTAVSQRRAAAGLPGLRRSRAGATRGRLPRQPHALRAAQGAERQRGRTGTDRGG